MPEKKTQYDKFEQAARELEADESEENFARVLKRVAAVSPRPDADKKKKPSG